MLRPVSLMLGIMLALGAGCALEPTPAEELDFADEIEIGKADTLTIPPGTYRSDGLVTDDALIDDGKVWITLMSDGTYRWESELDEGQPNFVDRGEYKLTRSRGKTFLKLTPENDGDPTRYEYRLSETTLSLQIAGAWVGFARYAEPRCDLASDCSAQEFATVACLGVYVCGGASECSFSCEARTNRWLRDAKKEYEEHGLDRFEAVDLERLPAQARRNAEHDQAIWDYEPQGYRRTVAGRVVYAVQLDHDGGFFVELYDSEGAHYASGGASESGDFSWKE